MSESSDLEHVLAWSSIRISFKVFWLHAIHFFSKIILQNYNNIREMWAKCSSAFLNINHTIIFWVNCIGYLFILSNYILFHKRQSEFTELLKNGPNLLNFLQVDMAWANLNMITKFHKNETYLISVVETRLLKLQFWNWFQKILSLYLHLS